MPRLAPFGLLPDPWMALDLAAARPDLPVASFGGPELLKRFEALGGRATLLPAGEGPGTAEQLLADRAVQAMLKRPSWLITERTSAALERAAQAKRCLPGTATAAVLRSLQGRRRLRDLAGLGEVPTPEQKPGLLRPDGSFAALAAELGGDVVVQGPRTLPGFASFRVRSEAEWAAARDRLGGQPVRVARFVEGRPASVLAVLDAAGRAVLGPVMAVLRGEPSLTDQPLRTVGDDFTWRGGPDPGERPRDFVEQMGKWLGKAGFKGAARFDFVVRPDGEVVLVGFDPRLDASFALLCARRPDVFTMLIRALEGDALPSRRLDPLPVGLASAYDITGAGGPPLDRSPDATKLRPVPHRRAGPGGLRGRWVIEGALVDAEGRLAP